MDNYFLTSKRLGFSNWVHNRNHFNTLYENSEVTRLIGGPFSEEQVEVRYQRELYNYNTHSVQYWPIFLLENGDFVGCCGLRPYSENVFELGFHLLPHHWGKGYAQEAASAIIAYAFSCEKLQTVSLFAGHNPNNTASQALLLKLKFQCIGTQFYEPTGLMHPSYMLHRHT